MKNIFILSCILLSSFSFKLYAAEPTCQFSSAGNWYCQYSGTVDRIYVNSGNMILLYFDTCFQQTTLDASASNGLTFNQRCAASIPLTDNPDFAKLFYSTALSAQASKRNVTIQMRGTHSSYVKMDRIWLAQ